MDWQAEIAAEFDKAEQARKRGNEGQARVCARRAAGLAAREYFLRRGVPLRTSSAYDVLRLVAEDPALAAGLRESATRLTVRVDEEFKPPSGVDLIAEARKLSAALRGEPPAA